MGPRGCGTAAGSASGLPRRGEQPPSRGEDPRPRSPAGPSPALPRRQARTHPPLRALPAGPLARRAAGATMPVTGSRDGPAPGARGGASGPPQEAAVWLVRARAAARMPRADWLGRGGARSRPPALAAESGPAVRGG